MIKLLEISNQYSDTWNLTFYFVAAVVILIGIMWAYYQAFIKPDKKKDLKENIIYNHSDDLIEKELFPKKKKKLNDEPDNYYSVFSNTNKEIEKNEIKEIEKHDEQNEKINEEVENLVKDKDSSLNENNYILKDKYELNGDIKFQNNQDDESNYDQKDQDEIKTIDLNKVSIDYSIDDKEKDNNIFYSYDMKLETEMKIPATNNKESKIEVNKNKNNNKKANNKTKNKNYYSKNNSKNYKNNKNNKK